MQVQKFDVITPPWALSKEDIPIHIKIEKSITPKIKSATVSVPSGMRLNDIINISKYNYDNNLLTVHRCEQAPRSAFDYFGFVVATTELQQELQKEVKIPIVFHYHDGTIDELSAVARVVRPKLEVESIPDELILTDVTKPLTLSIGLRFSGFGNIVVSVECSVNGQVVTIDDSVWDNVLRQIYDAAPDIVEVNASINSGVERANFLSNEFRKFIKSGDAKRMLTGRATPAEVDEILQNLGMGEREKILNVFYNTIDGYLSKYLLDMIEKNPSSNIKLESKARIHAQLGMKIVRLELKISYVDSLRNAYPPIEKHIRIINQRKKMTTGWVDIPLVVKANEIGDFKDR